MKPNPSSRPSLADWRNRKVHFIGIGGCGMSALANVFHQLGAIVSGSDAKESMFTLSLRESGVYVSIGHQPSNVPMDALVVYSSAVRPDNPERVAARDLGLEELHRSGLLAELTRCTRTIAVCGAHGKTTTSALLAHVLSECGLSPSYVVGGLPKMPMAHSRAGDGDLLIIEADESDRSLVHYSVDTLLVTNIDLDHVRDGGYQTRAEVAEVIAQLGRKARLVLASNDASSYFRHLGNVESIAPSVNGTATSFLLGTHSYTAHSPGVHQMENAALVVETATRLGCAPESIRSALLTFPGLARRYDTIGQLASGAKVIDDYAHHPAEIEAVIRAARRTVDGRIFVAFQPHLFSRTAHFAKDFAQALSLADVAYVEDIYASRERPEDWPGVSRALILGQVVSDGPQELVAAPDRRELASMLKERTTSRDAVLVLGAGDIAELAKSLVS